MVTKTEVTELVYEILKQRDTCTLTEAREYMEAHGVVIQPNNSILRATISNLCKVDPHVIRVRRGVYQYVENLPEMEEASDKENSMGDVDEAEKEESIEKKDTALEISELTIAEVLEYLESTKKINWLKSPMEVIAENRENMNRIQDIYDMIGKKLREIEGEI
ncbi:MAG: hypothetical protein LIO86_13430 [Lachnospiraceae bacterium]|nr:hypothetical protein [Lachnospiraceae bacterium]